MLKLRWYKNAKKILDKMMDKFKITKYTYTGEEDKNDYLRNGEGTCYIYMILKIILLIALSDIQFIEYLR